MSPPIPYYKKPSKGQDIKRYVKFLSICKSPSATKEVLKTAPDSVVKTICNAAINAFQGDVQLSKTQKTRLKKYKSAIQSLISKDKPLKTKRKILIQKGGWSIVPILLSAVIGTLGSSLFARRN